MPDTKTNFDLVIVGESPLDVITDFTPPIKRPGGVMYSAIVGQAIGARVGVISQVGNDKIDGWLEKLSGIGLDVRGIGVANTKGIRYFIQNSNEVIPQVVTSTGRSLMPVKSDHIPSDYYNTSGALLYPYNRSILEKYANKVKDSGGIIGFDLQHDIDTLDVWERIIKLCDYVFASRNELMKYTEEDNLDDAVDEIRNLGAKNVVVKYGMGGSSIYTEYSEVIRIPAFLANFINTIGAGDIYNAVFMFSIINGDNQEMAGRKASLYASVYSEYKEFEKYYEALCETEIEKELQIRTSVIAPPEKLKNIYVYVAGHFMSIPYSNYLHLCCQLRCQ